MNLSRRFQKIISFINMKAQKNLVIAAQLKRKNIPQYIKLR